ncbi:DUF2062 domain-containing protein [bacterium]|nr:DUF2062 domain-containing protein [bacterium]
MAEETENKKIKWYDLKSQFINIQRKLVRIKAEPHDIALGLAIGIFIGFLPIMGIQMAVAGLACLPFKRANKAAAVAGVWITNPLTVIPIYAFIYWVGTFFYPAEHVVTPGTIMTKMTNVLELDGFIEQTKGFLALGADIFLPMCIGGAVVGLIAMIPTYFITKKSITAYRKRKAKKHAK